MLFQTSKSNTFIQEMCISAWIWVRRIASWNRNSSSFQFWKISMNRNRMYCVLHECGHIFWELVHCFAHWTLILVCGVTHILHSKFYCWFPSIGAYFSWLDGCTLFFFEKSSCREIVEYPHTHMWYVIWFVVPAVYWVDWSIKNKQTGLETWITYL